MKPRHDAQLSDLRTRLTEDAGTTLLTVDDILRAMEQWGDEKWDELIALAEGPRRR